MGEAIEYPEMYSDADLERLDSHCECYFGPIEGVFHEIVSPDIHVDVLFAAPTTERPWRTLITQGAGAHMMPVPEGLDAQEFGRAEYLICLPPDWELQKALVSDAVPEETYWPVRLLKTLARLPLECNCWLGLGHTTDSGAPFASNTKLCETLLLEPVPFADGAASCVLSNGDRVNFFSVVPLYREEADYAVENGVKALIHRLSTVTDDVVVDIKRPNACAKPKGFGGLFRAFAKKE